MIARPASAADKRRTFHQLHASGCFVIPNPWDPGSARYLQGLGFKALATTSSGFAWSHARADNHATRDMVLAHLSELVGATDVPINADFESGFARDAAGVAESVRLAVEMIQVGGWPGVPATMSMPPIGAGLNFSGKGSERSRLYRA